MNNTYPQTPGMNSPPGIPRDYQYGLTLIPTSNPLYPSGVGFAPISAAPYPSAASGNPSISSYPEASSFYLLVPNNPYFVFASPYPASTSRYPASSNSAYPASTSAFPTSSNSCYSTFSSCYSSCNSPHPAPTSAYPSSSNRKYPAFTSSYLAASYPTPASTNQSPGASPYPSMGSRIYDCKFQSNIMTNRYPQTPGLNPPPVIPRNYPCGPTPMLTFNPLYRSGVGFVPNMSAFPYPSAAFTSGNPSNSSYPSSPPSYLLVPNNPYLLFTSSYPASFNNPYSASTSHYAANSNSHHPASASAFPTSSNSYYPTTCNSPHPAPTTTYPSNRHYSASTSSYLPTSYPAPASRNQPPGASPYPSMASRAYDSRLRPSVNESNDDAVGINSLPDEIIEEVFGYLTQNQLGQIARVCRRWNMLTKSPVLWRKVNVKIFSFDGEENIVAKSFINGLPSCVTFIRLDFSGREDLDFEELCVKLHQNCPHVEELILVHCAISNILPEVINFCTKFLQCVKKLVLHYCHFSNCSRTVELNDNSKIEVLDLFGCYLFHFSKKQFSKLLYLKELRLEYTNANDSWFVDNSSFLNQLHVLDLGWTSITASTFLLIQRHGHNLKELYLCNSILEDHDLDFNNSVFPHLRTMCLSATYVTCEDVVSLMQSCPSLENVYVYEDVSKSFAEHPFVVANRYKSGIVKAINWDHNHDVDHSHN